MKTEQDQIPFDGVRYDLTLTKAGRKGSRLTINAKIDNGPLAGHTVSHSFDFMGHPAETYYEWSQFIRGVGLEKRLRLEKGQEPDDITVSVLHGMECEARFSAVVRVEYWAGAEEFGWIPVEKEYDAQPDEKKICTYRLESFQPARQKREIGIRRGFPKWTDYV